MLSGALRGDALTSVPDGFRLRLSLPWIRSMPLSCVLSLKVAVAGESVPAGSLDVILGSRRVPAAELGGESGWWFVQDRLVLAAPLRLDPGVHAVRVSFELLVPYLQAGPGRPLILPFVAQAEVELDSGLLPAGAARDVA
ncbi:hypothetical protein JHV56_11580 [Arthrobacter sp. BHU FT2]|nr:hypothetical protein [Arthrobacter sp. BHU FT2]